MSNECWRVSTLNALTEIHRILQIEENIFISCQMVAVHFLQYNTQGGTGKLSTNLQY